MRIGWLADPYEGVIGGAELASDALQADAPEGYEIVLCPPGRIEAADAYVVMNCVRYGADSVRRIGDVPVIKVVSDWWPHGDPTFRSWLLGHSTLVVLRSPLHRRHFPWAFTAPAALVPSPLRLAPFREASLPGQRRNDRAVWLGRLTDGPKGEVTALRWAEAQRIHLDVFGAGPAPPASEFVHVQGQIAYEDVPRRLGEYRWFVYLPRIPGSFGRSLVEAWAAGCRLVTNDFPGALWWIEHRPDDLDRGAELFWREVDRALDRSARSADQAVATEAAPA